MLLSTKAGGVGINLTTADTVVIFDSDWNPQNDIQAQARAHRIGQTKAVKVYRLLTRKTYEMHLFEAASMKLGLDYAVMHNMRAQSNNSNENLKIGSPENNKGRKKRKHGLEDEPDADQTGSLIVSENSAVGNLSKKEIERLLKHGAYDIFREEKAGISEEESRKFCEADIDQILQRSSVIVHDKKAASDATTSGLSFSKASFVASGQSNGENVAVDDPDFWTKVIGLSMVTSEQDTAPSLRKCRLNVKTGTYKETGFRASREDDDLWQEDTISIADDDADSDINDLNESDNERNINNIKNRSKKIKMKKESNNNYMNKITWNLTIYNKINDFFQNHNYGDWMKLNNILKLNLSANELAHACRLVLLRMLVYCELTTMSAEDFNQHKYNYNSNGIMKRLKNSLLFKIVYLAEKMYQDHLKEESMSNGVIDCRLKSSETNVDSDIKSQLSTINVKHDNIDLGVATNVDSPQMTVIPIDESKVEQKPLKNTPEKEIKTIKNEDISIVEMKEDTSSKKEDISNINTTSENTSNINPSPSNGNKCDELPTSIDDNLKLPFDALELSTITKLTREKNISYEDYLMSRYLSLNRTVMENVSLKNNIQLQNNLSSQNAFMQTYEILHPAYFDNINSNCCLNIMNWIKCLNYFKTREVTESFHSFRFSAQMSRKISQIEVTFTLHISYHLGMKTAQRFLNSSSLNAKAITTTQATHADLVSIGAPRTVAAPQATPVDLESAETPPAMAAPQATPMDLASTETPPTTEISQVPAPTVQSQAMTAIPRTTALLRSPTERLLHCFCKLYLGNNASLNDPPAHWWAFDHDMFLIEFIATVCPTLTN